MPQNRKRKFQKEEWVNYMKVTRLWRWRWSRPCFVTISNAVFKDADSIDYKEAVDVKVNAVGVFIGDEKGNFNAKENLTRE